jgi:phage tail-like protein
VRRTALYIKESLYRGTQWVVFEPNNESLWSQIRLNVGAFMHDLFIKGAFQGTDPKKAYFVKCDSETTTQTDIDRGIVNILVGFAPLKPAEFVIIKIQQITQQEAPQMSQFNVNTTRFDPYKNFKFRVKWDGKYVAGLSKMSALKMTVPVINHRIGAKPSTTRLSPGNPIEFSPITLERGVTYDLEFENWANKIWKLNSNPGSDDSLKDFRKDLIIEILNESGQVAIAYKVYRCWISEYQAIPDFDANGSAVAIQSITIQNEGWERDEAVTEPTEQIL